MATEDKVLNGSGLAHLTEKIKEYVDEHAGGLPEYPTDNGNYNLMVTISSSAEPVLKWVILSGVWQYPTQIVNDLRIPQAATVNKINNDLQLY